MLSKKIRQYLIDFLVGSLWVQSEGEDRYQRRFEAIGYTAKHVARYSVALR